MTHDPREALEIVQQMIRGKPMAAWITDTRTMKSLGDVVQEALTSPGEQEPVAWQRWNPSNGWTDCRAEDVEHYKRFSKVRPLYLSPPPAAGWNEAIEAATLICRDAANEADGNASRAAMAEELAAAIEALRREAPAPEGVSTPPAAVEKEADDWRDDPSADERWNAGLDFAMGQFCAALGVDPKSVRWDAATETLDGDVNAVIWNILRARFGEDWDPATSESSASVEARLREEFLAWIDRRIETTIGQQRNAYASRNDVIGSRHHAAQCELWTVRAKFEALSAVGDEAKKSEGAIYAEVSKRETPPEERAEIERVIDKALQDHAICEALERRPSDPTADRREIVARLRKLIGTATLLYQNAVGCAANHHSVDFEQQGLPGWLRDCERDIRAASAALAEKADFPVVRVKPSAHAQSEEG